MEKEYFFKTLEKILNNDFFNEFQNLSLRKQNEILEDFSNDELFSKLLLLLLAEKQQQLENHNQKAFLNTFVGKIHSELLAKLQTQSEELKKQLQTDKLSEIQTFWKEISELKTKLNEKEPEIKILNDYKNEKQRLNEKLLELKDSSKQKRELEKEIEQKNNELKDLERTTLKEMDESKKQIKKITDELKAKQREVADAQSIFSENKNQKIKQKINEAEKLLTECWELVPKETNRRR